MPQASSPLSRHTARPLRLWRMKAPACAKAIGEAAATASVFDRKKPRDATIRNEPDQGHQHENHVSDPQGKKRAGYRTGEILPLTSRPRAFAKAPSGPCPRMIACSTRPDVCNRW